MLTSLPLLARETDDPIAWLSEGLSALNLPAGEVTTSIFLQQVQALAGVLPNAQYAINVCTNRYLFLLSLCAVVLRGQTNLLPPNKRINTQHAIAEEFQACYLLHDGVAELANLPHFDVLAAGLEAVDDLPQETAVRVPEIDPTHIAVISFTSGSTGKSKPNLKSWETIAISTEINACHMLPNQDETFYHLATVPGQHMWGLETSVIMALFAKVCIVDSQPFFPRDIVAQLARLPEPRTLVSTPVHLRAMTSLKDSLPKLANVLCATAPLEAALAQQIEAQFQTSLREVYGCSEVGSMAVRKTARTDIWRAFDGLDFRFDEGGTTQVGGAHLPEATALEDCLLPLGNNTFRLQGRRSDQIKIAGKRGSLVQINQVLLECKGVIDGAIFLPPQTRSVPRLAALVVLDASGSVARVKKHLKAHLDDAFLPRPLLAVDQLPREENGKLSRQRLLDFYQHTKSPPA